MNKILQKSSYVTLLLICLSATNIFGHISATTFADIPSSTFEQNITKVFIMVHFEAGRDTTHPLINDILFNEFGYPPDSLTTNSLTFQRLIWPSVVSMVQTADSFNIKLTLALQSQMAEYILRDTQKINIFNDWVQNGHELAMHHHGIGHVDWGGYTNRFQGTVYPGDDFYLDRYLNSGLYRGDMQQSFIYLQQLATTLNDSVVTGCITDTQIDKPDEIRYLTEGGNQEDLISIPDTVSLPNETFYFISHCQLVSVYTDINNLIIEDDSINYEFAVERLDYIKANLDQVDENEIMGIVFHAFDQYRFPDIYRELFYYLNQNQVNNNSIKELMSVNSGQCCVGLTGNIDASADDFVDIGDLVYLVDYMFRGGLVPICFEESDVVSDGSVDIGDLVALVGYMFRNGPELDACPTV